MIMAIIFQRENFIYCIFNLELVLFLMEKLVKLCNLIEWALFWIVSKFGKF